MTATLPCPHLRILDAIVILEPELEAVAEDLSPIQLRALAVKLSRWARQLRASAKQARKTKG